MAILLLSYNVRKRVKIFIDRHFYKNKHDYRKEWLELTARLSSKLNVQELLPPLANTIFETFWIKRTILWLYDDQEREFQIAQPADDMPSRSMKWEPALIQALKDQDYPLVLDDPQGDQKEDPKLSRILDEQQKAMFQSMGVSILVPLIVEKQLIGILGLSKSHSGTPLNYEDHDLMKTMAKQAASSILNAKLSQRLVNSKELDTFHSLSIFLLHDLKNFVSMISLVVENMNMNLNFDNPEFRKDALASLSLTVEKMKRLMERLAALSKTPDPCYASVDLNAVVQETLVEARKSIKSKIIKDLHDLPVIHVDPVQIKKVVTNLLLNAEEAITGEGEIRLATSVQDGMVTLSVSDNGCGIPSEFLENRLFKPFSTTKSQGFGIGLYQLKSILEAHGGRIQANSEVGKGSTFTVALPIENGN
jgi:putative PEP-CTERM system histidine kinase